MLYQDADNDLEESSLDDLRELLRVGGGDRVNLLVLCDRHPEDSSTAGYSNERVFDLPDWSGTLLLEIGREKATVLEDWGEQDMADGATLRRFVETASRLRPAARRALILADHGSGWPGICSDESSEDPEGELTLAEISSALQGAGRLDFLGFDACLMATAEVALAMAPRARVLVASEELEPWLGWDYALLARALEAQPDMEGVALGRLAVQGFRRSFERESSLETRNEGAGITLSVIDLDRVPPLGRALDGLATAALEGLQRRGRPYWLALARARARAEQYGSEGGPEDPGGGAVDLGDLARRLSAADPALKPPAEALQQALRAAVVDQVRGDLRPEASGLSLYFPAEAEGLEGYAGLPGMGAWTAFLEAYLARVRVAAGEPLLKGLTVRGHTFSSRAVAPEEVDRSWFVVLQDGVVLEQQPVPPDGQGRLRARWDGRIRVLGPPDRAIPCPLSAVEGRMATSRMQLSQRAGPWVDVALHFSLEDDRLAWATVSGGRRTMRVEAGDRLRTVYLSFDAEGGADTAVYDGEILEVRSPEDLVVRREEPPEGPVEAGFLVYDFDGDRELSVRAAGGD